MNKQELQNKISELEETLWHLQEELEGMEEKEAEKGKIWKPGYDKEYWYMGCFGGVYKDSNLDTNSDKGFVNIGNCYPTDEKAKFEANREKYTRLFRQYVEQHSKPLDWKDREQEKYFCTYSYDFKDILYNHNYTDKAAFVIYASSEEVLKEAIDFIGEDNFKKYILEVKE